MSILDINMKDQSKHFTKTIATYLVLSILAIVVNKVYGMFGHGVSSPAMTWMFLYPLIGGVLLCFGINIFANKISRFSGYRLAYNIYNSGIATLTLGSFLKGVIQIAGASSPYIVFYYVVGGVFVAVGLTLMLMIIAGQKKVNI